MLLPLVLVAENVNDSLKNYLSNPVNVISYYTWGKEEISPERGNFTNSLSKYGFGLIRKGPFIAQDVYADGLKKSDIAVVIDGERCHSACPNRMDSPVTRVNPLEVNRVSLVKSSDDISSGIGGSLEFQRDELQEPLIIRTAIIGSALSERAGDAAFSIDYRKNRFTGRYSTGRPFDDAKGKSFTDLYNYKDNYNYSFAEAAFTGSTGEWEYRTGFSFTRDVPFPYLTMDERDNIYYSAYIKYLDNKLYLNYSGHIMNNGLRKSTMEMETDAKSLTIGLTGGFYEIYFRNWNADNFMNMMMNGNMMRIDNDMIPDVSSVTALASHSINIADGFVLKGKAGLAYTTAGEFNKDNYKMVSSDAADYRVFPVISLGAGYTTELGKNLDFGLLLESAAEQVEPELLFIALRRPMGNPGWYGNPGLEQPIKAALRADIRFDFLRFELFAMHISNYANLSMISNETTKFTTFKNINAAFTGANLFASTEYLDFGVSYTLGENLTDDNPMPEIMPLQVSTTIKAPEIAGIQTFLRHTYNDAQTRVDNSINEFSTPAWNKLDLGFSYKSGDFRFGLVADNITNEQFTRHLSYLRNPFSNGMTVFDPGTSIRLNIEYFRVYD